MASTQATTALVFGGGGARTAYQAGVLRYIAEEFPEAEVAVVTGMGAGGINAMLLAGQSDPWPSAARALLSFWSGLTPADVFRPRSLWDLITQLVRREPSAKQSLLDPAPLRGQLETFLPTADDGKLTGIRQNVEEGWLEGVALSTTAYGTLETVLWSQGREMCFTEERLSARATSLTVDHVVASTSLALLFPAVMLDGEWHGAGVGLFDPIRPGIQLGADRVLALSTRAHQERRRDTKEEAYPSPLQIASILSNTLLLDPLTSNGLSAGRRTGDPDVRMMPESDEHTPNDVLALQPSIDPTAVAEALDVDVDATLGTVIQYLHGQGAALPDLLSMLLFDRRYLRRLLLLGYEDASSGHEQLARFFYREPQG